METKFEFKSILSLASKEEKEGRKEGKDPVPPDSSCWVGSLPQPAYI
jgi:hypothetical protein